MESLDQLASTLARRAIESAISQVEAAFARVRVTTDVRPVKATKTKPIADKRVWRPRAEEARIKSQIADLLKADPNATTKHILDAIGLPETVTNRYHVTAGRRAVGIPPRVPFFKLRALAKIAAQSAPAPTVEAVP